MSVVSKNLYELLGNDPELDPNRAPEPPTKVVDKPAQRAGKRNGTTEAPVKETTAAPRIGGRRDNFTGSEQAARDKTAGSSNNRAKPTDDGVRRDRQPREGGDRSRGGRGGRGAGYRGNRGDRHDRSGVAAPHSGEKQAAHGWGGETGTAEYADEKAGLADAHAEESKEGVVADSTTPVDAEGVAADQVPAEEDNTKSYEQYLADLAEKRQALAGDSLAIRKANEGSNQKFPEGKAVERTHEEYFAGAGAKQHRAKENKTKNSLALDGQYYAAPDTGDRGRGGARGGRGEGRGGRGRGEGRGRGGRGRGEGRGGAPSGARTEQRSGPRGGAINTKDESAFPSLGA